ncbi:MAG: protein translocase subunit SecF [Ruaniaceae bacterium]|nr:protein translocase subunit SecF [Ruaniaceae bacterium]
MKSLAQLGNELYFGRKSFNIVGNRRRWLTIGLVFIVLSIGVLLVRGLNPGVEFSGGSEFRIEQAATTDSAPAIEVLANAGVSETPRVSVIGDDSLRVQTSQLTSEEIESIRSALAEAYGSEQISSTFIGPAWGQDVTQKALMGMGIFLVLVAVVMALYFRTWTMSLAAITGLIHDLIITVGVYALVGFEVTPASVIGFLTILGYSLYDTVVVFDKVRENTANALEQNRVTYAEGANLAVNQTIVRSINTSVVGVLPVGAILFVGTTGLGAGTLRDISLALFVGMIISTISSIFIATPIEVAFRERTAAYAEHTKAVLAKRSVSEDLVAVDATSAAILGTSVAPGGHQGQSAQPRKKPRKER